MWSMSLLAKDLPLWLPGTPDDLSHIINSYYRYTTIFFFIFTLLLVRETLKIASLLGIKNTKRRTLLYLVATPSFVFLILLNWYIIGVFFTVYGLRKFLEGSRFFSGAALGISAATNLISAVPSLGMLFGADNWKERLNFCAGFSIAVASIYLPLIALNSFPHTYVNSSGTTVHFPYVFMNTSFISDFISYHAGWYIEGSWMLAFLNPYDPRAHYIFPALFSLLCIIIFLKGISIRSRIQTKLEKDNFVIMMSWLFVAAYLFSSYVATPQMNLVLLPFFVFAPIVRYYPEFLAYDILNSLVIVLGFSQPFLVFGIRIAFNQFGPPWPWMIGYSPIELLVVIKSVWIGKFLLVDGIFAPHTPLTKAPTSSFKELESGA